MARYIGRRLIVLVPVVWLVFTLVFSILHILPGDPVQLMLAGAEAGVSSPERMAQLRKSMGLDQPLYIQYGGFILHAVRGDLGESIRFQSPVNRLVLTAASQTLQLSVAGLAAALTIGLPLGIIAVMLSRLPGIELGRPSTVVYADVNAPVTTHRPPPSGSAPPPTLAPPTATIRPTATPTDPPAPASTPTAEGHAGTTYTVQQGDELKQIAAAYGVSIWKILDANDIPDPDSLRVGQVLTIPGD